MKFLGLGRSQVNHTPETEILTQIILHVCPCINHARAENAFAIVVELLFRHFLHGHLVRTYAVACGLTSDRHAAGLMVGGHHNQGLVGVCEIKIVGNLKSLVECDHLAHGCAAVVAVAGMVDASPFHHHEKFIGRNAHKLVKSGLSELREGNGTLDGIDGIPYVRMILGGTWRKHQQTVGGGVDAVNPIAHADVVFREDIHQSG